MLVVILFKYLLSQQQMESCSFHHTWVMLGSIPASVILLLILVTIAQLFFLEHFFFVSWCNIDKLSMNKLQSGALIASMMYCTMYSAKRLLRETSVFARALFNGLLLLNLCMCPISTVSSFILLVMHTEQIEIFPKINKQRLGWILLLLKLVYHLWHNSHCTIV